MDTDFFKIFKKENSSEKNDVTVIQISENDFLSKIDFLKKDFCPSAVFVEGGRLKIFFEISELTALVLVTSANPDALKEKLRVHLSEGWTLESL